MRTLIAFVFVIFAFSLTAQTTVKKVGEHTYEFVKAQPKTAEELVKNATKTADTVGNMPIYATPNGKRFIIKTSKAGNPYRCYIKEVN